MNKFHPLLISISLTALATSLHAAAALGTPDPATIEYPDGAPPSAAEVTLGHQLFYEPRLSGNGTQSCASCHNPDLGTGDGLKKSLGSEGHKVGRHTPHIYNLAWSTLLFWDGRAGSLEEQALGPIQAAGEMNLPIDQAVARLKAIPGYNDQFIAVYGKDGVTKENIGKAIAAFERTIISRNSAFDRYIAGDKDAMSAEAVRGLALYQGKAKCIDCHNGPNFTDDSFHSLGFSDADPGRGALDKNESLKNAFKTPGLRNVALTAPYMHDGSMASLEDVVQYYNHADKKPGVNSSIQKLNLSDQEVRDLVIFLGTLTDPVIVKAPSLPN
jgi:cytochrome c peroxidase